MSVIVNIARMTTATTGAGTITLGSAATGYLSFAAAGVSDGDVVPYAIVDGSNREVGWGVYTASGTTLSRTVLTSTNSNNAISLSGTAEVFVSPIAESVKFRGCRVKKNADQTTANYTGGAIVAWDAEDFDTDAFHDTVTNNSRITIPANKGITYVEIVACVATSLDTGDRFHFIHVYKNGSLYLTPGNCYEGGFSDFAINITTGPIAVAAGDYFEINYATESDTSITVQSAYSFFALTVLG